MANYKETTLAGTAYIRANSLEVINEADRKFISFNEERVINLDDGEVLRKYAGSVISEFTPENADTQFALLNPITGEDTGQTMSYQDVYTSLYSLYLSLALARDSGKKEVVVNGDGDI